LFSVGAVGGKLDRGKNTLFNTRGGKGKRDWPKDKKKREKRGVIAIQREYKTGPAHPHAVGKKKRAIKKAIWFRLGFQKGGGVKSPLKVKTKSKSFGHLIKWSKLFRGWNGGREKWDTICAAASTMPSDNFDLELGFCTEAWKKGGAMR